VAARTQREIDETAEEIRTLGGEALAIKTDVSKEDEVNEMVRRTIEEFGTVDILINNAAVVEPIGAVDEVKAEDWGRLIDINLKGTFLCCKAVLGPMKKRRKGKIINFSSIAGKIGFPTMSAYCASKFGVIGFTQSLAEEVLEFDINVNAIYPGEVDTKMHKMVEQKRDRWEDLDRSLLMSPEEVIPLVMFLSSEESDRISGDFISLNWRINRKRN
jgi:NAD(P)-dependent dehydrogenase (short-subunit alcohol dehydrogenase family)